MNIINKKSSQDSPKWNSDYLFFSLNTPIRMFGLILLAITGALATASSFLNYNLVVKGVSFVRPVGGTKLVESPLEGVIQYIAVQPNQIVNQGDVIAILEQNELEITKENLNQNIQQKQQKIAQIDLQKQLLLQQIETESDSFKQEILMAQIQLEQIKKESQKQKAAAYATVKEMQAGLDLARNESETYRNLFAQGIISALELKEKQAALSIAKARLENAELALEADNFSSEIATKKITQLISQKQTRLTDLNQQRESLLRERLAVEYELIQEQKKLEQVEIALEKSVIRATAKGVILKLHLNNEQQFINANDAIAEIIPQDVDLIINSFVSSQDIDKVNVGQIAKLQINACPYQDFGTLEGVITEISPDIVSSESIGNLSRDANTNYFAVSIQPAALSLYSGKNECTLKPGMEARANIISRQETFLQFILRKMKFSN